MSFCQDRTPNLRHSSLGHFRGGGEQRTSSYPDAVLLEATLPEQCEAGSGAHITVAVETQGRRRVVPVDAPSHVLCVVYYMETDPLKQCG